MGFQEQQKRQKLHAHQQQRQLQQATDQIPGNLEIIRNLPRTGDPSVRPAYVSDLDNMSDVIMRNLYVVSVTATAGAAPPQRAQLIANSTGVPRPPKQARLPGTMHVSTNTATTSTPRLAGTARTASQAFQVHCALCISGPTQPCKLFDIKGGWPWRGSLIRLVTGATLNGASVAHLTLTHHHCPQHQEIVSKPGFLDL